MASVLIGLGSNLGNREALLAQAVARLAAAPGVEVRRVSRWVETAPIGGPADQGPFLNGAALLDTWHRPAEILAMLKSIERELGRVPDQRWSARPIDLDLLLYGDEVIDAPDLTVPHPRMAWRRFVLRPAAEIAATLRHPVIGWTVAELLAHLDAAPPYIALAGPIAAGKTALAERIARQCGARWLAEPVDDRRLTDFYGDPATRGWQTELSFLDERVALLSRSTSQFSRSAYTLSDFWYNQGLAFARVWLAPAAWAEYAARWRQGLDEIVRPRLVVLLDAPLDELVRRMSERGRPYEAALTGSRLEQLRAELRAEATQRGIGPVMHLTGLTTEAAAAEVIAAMESMQP